MNKCRFWNNFEQLLTTFQTVDCGLNIRTVIFLLFIIRTIHLLKHNLQYRLCNFNEFDRAELFQSITSFLGSIALLVSTNYAKCLKNTFYICFTVRRDHEISSPQSKLDWLTFKSEYNFWGKCWMSVHTNSGNVSTLFEFNKEEFQIILLSKLGFYSCMFIFQQSVVYTNKVLSIKFV